MAWNPLLPDNTSKIRLLPAQAKANWAAIENGNVPQKKVRLAKQDGNPTGVAETGFLYTKTENSKTELFYKKDTVTPIQLTGVLPSAATNGYTFLPGGLLLQWGVSSGIVGSATPTTITFATSNIAFPSNCFNVSCTLIAKAGGSSSGQAISVVTGTVSKTKFDYNFSGSSPPSGGYTSLYWIAIGN